MQLESLETRSCAEFVASLPATERDRILRQLPMRVISRYNWSFWARPSQLWPAGAWRIWLIVAGGALLALLLLAKALGA